MTNWASRRIAARVREFSNPIVLVAGVNSTRITDLGRTFDLFRSAWTRLVATPVMRNHVRAAIGRIEAVLTASRKRWFLHLHWVADSDGLSVEALDDVWRAYTNERGRITLDPRAVPNNIDAYAQYICKVRTFCPTPGSGLDVARLFHFFRGSHGRHMTVTYSRGRTARGTDATALNQDQVPRSREVDVSDLIEANLWSNSIDGVR